jgi:hypothetical protein
VNELRPALETVVARQRVLRGGELHGQIGGAQRDETFSGLFAQLFERGAFRQMTGGVSDTTISFRISPASARRLPGRVGLCRKMLITCR